MLQYGKMDDPLKELLKHTGWTYEDVLQRLEEYKKTNVIKCKNDTNSNNCASVKKTLKDNCSGEIKLIDCNYSDTDSNSINETQKEDSSGVINLIDSNYANTHSKKQTCNKDAISNEGTVDKKSNTIKDDNKKTAHLYEDSTKSTEPLDRSRILSLHCHAASNILTLDTAVKTNTYDYGAVSVNENADNSVIDTEKHNNNVNVHSIPMMNCKEASTNQVEKEKLTSYSKKLDVDKTNNDEITILIEDEDSIDEIGIINEKLENDITCTVKHAVSNHNNHRISKEQTDLNRYSTNIIKRNREHTEMRENNISDYENAKKNMKMQETVEINSDLEEDTMVKDRINQTAKENVANSTPSSPFFKLVSIINKLSKRLDQSSAVSSDNTSNLNKESSQFNSICLKRNLQNLKGPNTEDETEAKKLKLYETQNTIKSYENTLSKTDDTDMPRNNTSIEASSLTNKLLNRKYNASRLISITNILSNKLGNINEENTDKSEPPQNASDIDYCTNEASVNVGRQNADKNFNLIRELDVETPTCSKTFKVQEKNKISHKPIRMIIDDVYTKSVFDEKATEKISTSSCSGIKPTKTKDVTKIKGWKNKKFVTESPLLLNCQKDSILPSMDVSKPSTSSGNESKSAFTSDILDQYIKENSNLNISYEVPKLKAEDTLKQTYTDKMLPDYSQEIVKTQTEVQNKRKKPKTLAEKIEMGDCPTVFALDYLFKLDPKKRMKYSSTILNLKRKLMLENIPFKRTWFLKSSSITNTQSFVIYNNRKLKVPSIKLNNKKVLCRINRPERGKDYKKKIVHKPKRYSLLKTFDCKGVPFRKNEWEGVNKLSPKIFLEVTPIIGKPLDPKIRHLIENDNTSISEHQLNFALSALKATETEMSQPKRFVFRIPYQKYLSFYKRIDATGATIPKVSELKEEIDDEIKIIVDKLLDYVDVLDETKNVILEDEVSSTPKTKDIEPTQNKPTIKNQFLPFKRAAIEMRRLNCKVVSFVTEDENVLDQPCLKEYCKLGCVCKSIKGSYDTLLNSHCGLYKCMFKCECKIENNEFSERVCCRIQDEATKDLAKVEKEFTQTIIKTHNQLIVVGDGTERKKRVARAPKKFEDFVEEYHFENLSTERFCPTKLTTIAYNDIIIYPCFVNLLKYNFKNIIPFCMEHEFYKCHCNYISTPAEKTTETNITQPEKNCIKESPLNNSAIEHLLKEIKTISNNENDDFTSRTNGVGVNYLLRNRTKAHYKKIRSNSDEFQRKLEKFLLSKVEANKKRFKKRNANAVELRKRKRVKTLSENCKDKNEFVDVANKSVNVSVSKDSINNESLVLPHRDTSEKELKLQRRKRKSGLKEKTFNKDEQLSKTFLMYLVKHNSQIRILPWSVLSAQYESGAFQLWCLNGGKGLVYVTENGMKPSSKHFNVKIFEHFIHEMEPSSDLLWCIINKTVPTGQPKDQIWVLLFETCENIWKICGICQKNQSNDLERKFSISPIAFYGDIEDIVNENTKSKKELAIVSNKRTYLAKELVPDTIHKAELHIQQVVQAHIPSITSSCRWQVISTKKPFGYLSFTRCKFTISYIDIRTTFDDAVLSKVTIKLTWPDVTRTYPHRQFGIYFDFHHEDTIFIGPYFSHENCDITFLMCNDTVGEINDGLVLPVYSYWYRQSTPIGEKPDNDVEGISTDATFIDLTSDDEQLMNSFVTIDSNSTETDGENKEMWISQYLITNVPELGYISAALNTVNGNFDVTCPATSKINRFISSTNALKILQRTLMRKFILVPPTFNLEVSMVNQVNLNEYKPLKGSFLNGYHMLGNFGVRNASNVTLQDLKTFGLSTMEMLQVLQQRERKLLIKPLAFLSRLLNIKTPSRAPMLPFLGEVSEKALIEVDHLEKLDAKYTKRKEELRNHNNVLSMRCLQLIRALPEEMRINAQKLLDKILQSNNTGLNSASRIKNVSIYKSTEGLAENSEGEIIDVEEVEIFEKCNTDSVLEVTSSSPLQLSPKNKISGMSTNTTNSATTVSGELICKELINNNAFKQNSNLLGHDNEFVTAKDDLILKPTLGLAKNPDAEIIDVEEEISEKCNISSRSVQQLRTKKIRSKPRNRGGMVQNCTTNSATTVSDGSILKQNSDLLDHNDDYFSAKDDVILKTTVGLVKNSESEIIDVDEEEIFEKCNSTSLSVQPLPRKKISRMPFNRRRIVQNRTTLNSATAISGESILKQNANLLDHNNDSVKGKGVLLTTPKYAKINIPSTLSTAVAPHTGDHTNTGDQSSVLTIRNCIYEAHNIEERTLKPQEKAEVQSNTMATLTAISKSAISLNSSANFIAVRDGKKVKYFKVVSKLKVATPFQPKGRPLGSGKKVANKPLILNSLLSPPNLL
ncbi:hypothetical protein FQA39_LY12567 [Lamprigera yunnana]|nr:hypothetical protein FQA39_LY12567 [Lamprigera yunnana]